MLDPDAIRLAYKGLLEREPESQAAIDYWAGEGHDLDRLIYALVRTPEFAALHARRTVDPYFSSEPQTIETAASSEQLAALFERTLEQWTALGDTEPFWSVLQRPEFRGAKLDDAKRAAFYATGAAPAVLLDRAAERTGLPKPQGVCLELGCGVGRVTRHLAKRFERVIAIDISPGNLRNAMMTAAREGLGNIQFVHLASLADLDKITGYDVFHSLLTLQRNSPPVQRRLLDWALRGLNPGGQFLFQTQTWTPDYAFVVEDYLSGEPAQMDTHSLPMHEILAVAAQHNAVLADVWEDAWTDQGGSHTFFGRRA